MRTIIDEGDIMLMDRPNDHGMPVACIQPRAADPACTPMTVRVSDPASCLHQRSAGLTGAPHATGTKKSHFRMAIHLYSPCFAAACVCSCLFCAFMLDCYCWALGASLLMVSMVTSAAIPHQQSPPSGQDFHNYTSGE